MDQLPELFYPCSMTHRNDAEGPATVTRGILPSEFMRQLRPEIFSDTIGHTDYALDENQLGYHLETITSRNQTHAFEIFCRKLCERVVCPNLRPQTGPDGGGDSKADTETFPVADEITERYFIGSPTSGQERWAFAFSAKKTWSEKVRRDVKGLIETGRAYDRILFVTNRFAKSKDVARIEKELLDAYRIPVTIFDRSWILSEVIDKGRKDIAYNYLGVGSEITDASKLGPNDYSRLQQLEEVEREIEDSDAYRGAEAHRAFDGLVAARLSRELGKPRVETDGRFARAIRLADRYSGLHQQLEARYEQIWTAYWWFDDFAGLNEGYAQLETLAADSEHARQLEFLANLLQTLFSSVIHGHLDRAACELDTRAGRLAERLRKLAIEPERPNNALEAETSLRLIEMNIATLAEDEAGLRQVWLDFTSIIERAEALGEFNAERLANLIEAAESVGEGDPEYDALIERLADFMSKRTGEAQGALILLRRAVKLDLVRHFEMIRLLSKAAARLTKKEHSDELSDAMCHLAIAYRSAGLFWAARASCIFAISTMVIDAEESGRMQLRFAVIAKLWATLSFDLGHMSDFVTAMGLLKGATETLPFSEQSREKFRQDAQDHEYMTASRILNLTNAQLDQLTEWPDIFEQYQLFMARAALLYVLGYQDLLREDGSIPEGETDEGIVRMFSLLASQPAGAARRTTNLIVNDPQSEQVFSTKLLGMRVDVHVGGDANAVVAAETVIGCLEAFFATAIEQRVSPHTEQFSIFVDTSADVQVPEFNVDLSEMRATLTWPIDLPPTRYTEQRLIRGFWVDVAARLLGATCFTNEGQSVVETLVVEERVFDRMMLVSAAANSYHRITGRYLTRADHLIEGGRTDFPRNSPRPEIERVAVRKLTEPESSPTEPRARIAPENHQDAEVSSVIDLHLWNEAKWRGAGFASNEPGYPPFLALIFAQEVAASKIFERWRTRIGPYDEQDRIRVSIVRSLPGHGPNDYSVQIAANPPIGEDERGTVFAMTTRSLVVHPSNPQNLENFLGSYRHYRAYYLIPAIWHEGMSEPNFLIHLPVLKRELIIVDAADVVERSFEWIALEMAKEDAESAD